jgi:hypothetical protein
MAVWRGGPEAAEVFRYPWNAADRRGAGGLPRKARRVNSLFAAVPQIERNYCPITPAPPQTYIDVGATKKRVSNAGRDGLL